MMTFLQKRSKPKKSLARTCFLAKKQSVPPKAGLRIRLEKWGEISGTRFARPAFWLPKNRLVRLWWHSLGRTHLIETFSGKWMSDLSFFFNLRSLKHSGHVHFNENDLVLAHFKHRPLIS